MEECIDWATHGAQHGAGVPDSKSRPERCSMIWDLKSLHCLLDEQGTPHPTSKSLKACVEAPMEGDLEKERRATLACLRSMSNTELREAAKQWGIGRKKQKGRRLCACTRKHLKSLATDASSDSESSKDGSKENGASLASKPGKR